MPTSWQTYQSILRKRIEKGSMISLKNVFVGDMWIANMPYKEKGNYKKVRPVIISRIDGEKIYVYKVTSTNSSWTKELDPRYPSKHKSYVTVDDFLINDYDLIRKIACKPKKY